MAQRRAALQLEPQAHLGTGQRGVGRDPRQRGPLGARAGQEGAAGRLRREQLAQFDRRARRAGAALDAEQPSLLERNPRADRFIGRPRGGLQPPRGRGQRGQRLAAEAVAAQRPELLGALQLGGRVASEGALQLVGGDARAVVAHAQPLQPRALGLRRNPPRAGVERVLDQLLERRGGALDHLAGRDLRGDLAGQLADRSGRRRDRRHP